MFFSQLGHNIILSKYLIVTAFHFILRSFDLVAVSINDMAGPLQDVFGSADFIVLSVDFVLILAYFIGRTGDVVAIATQEIVEALDEVLVSDFNYVALSFHKVEITLLNFIVEPQYSVFISFDHNVASCHHI